MAGVLKIRIPDGFNPNKLGDIFNLPMKKEKDGTFSLDETGLPDEMKMAANEDKKPEGKPGIDDVANTIANDFKETKEILNSKAPEETVDNKAK